ncbi:ABC transporter substrate-binding protein [Zavarzinia sp. CC-PAN008]|uniref:ABC transporter substrate-binding protein n=1 Tax=Zavarzinia sp. CC-PAN008 TaxID=3243332 RepID=UPI003F74A723
MRLILLAVLLLAASPALAAERLTLVLDWFVNPDHAALIVAQERGFFRDAGLDVELIAPADPNDPPKLAAAGKADLAITYQPQLMLHVENGLPLKRIATLVAQPLNALIVLEDGPVRDLADLKGKRIGYSVGGFEEILLATMLKGAGLSLADVELINVNFSLSPALMAGQVDGVIGAYRNFDLPQLRLAGKPGRAFPVEEFGVPVYDELIVVAAQGLPGDARLPRFVQAVERAGLFVANHPDAAWGDFAKAHPDLDDELNRAIFKETWPRLAVSPAALDPARYARFAAFMAEAGLIKAARPVADYAVTLD